MSLTNTSRVPSPPPDREGWPWTVEPDLMPATTPAGTPWPRISVVTPSFNQGQFLEQTIRSVLLQGYPNLEYIVIDGGSTDESIAILKKYESQIAHWVSEPDRGQSHAINKGFERATGEIMCWLNSDDFYLPGTLRAVGESLASGSGTFAVVGHCVQVYADGRPPYHGTGRFEGLDRLLQFWKGYQMHQPSIFWRREVFEKVGYLDESQHYIMDFDYWVRMARYFEFRNLDLDLSCATYHAEAKTGDDFVKYMQELRRQAPTYWPSPLTATYWNLRVSLAKHDCVSLARRLSNSVAYRTRLALRLVAGDRTR
jgi:glycosyltransferase involved in cell wall biosynthesis